LAEEKKKKPKFNFVIVQEKCMDCASCWYECTFEGGSGAIEVSYNTHANFVINQELCIRCGRCFRACPVEAIERVKVAEGA